MSWCGCVCDTVSDLSDAAVDLGEDMVDSLVDAVEEGIATVGGWISEAGEGLGSLLESAADAAAAVWDWIAEAGSSLWDWVKQVAHDVWEWTASTAADAWDWVREAAGSAWDWVQNAAATVWGWIEAAAHAVGEFIEEKVLPFLERALWVLILSPLLLSALMIWIVCEIVGVVGKEYDIIEGLFELDEDLLAERPVAFLPTSGNYVIVSDLHLFIEGDPLDRFRQLGNHELYRAVLASYAAVQEPYTLIENGDIEDLWMREVTLRDAVLETFFVLTFPLTASMGEEYDNHRTREQAVRIFESNADVYQLIRTLYHDRGRFVRVAGNHDDPWRQAEFIDGLRVVYPELEVFDYAFLGDYGSDMHHHGGKSPEVIVAHGHQLDEWNTPACSAAGEIVTMVVSGIPSLAAGYTERADWESKLWGQGFGDELASSWTTIDEVAFCDTVREDFGDHPYVPQFILGHTHSPREDPDVPDRWLACLRGHRESPFPQYENSGTAGRWEEFLWCVTVENGDVQLRGWTWGDDHTPVCYDFENVGGYLQVAA